MGLAGPRLMTFLLLRVSGVALLERGLVKTRPATRTTSPAPRHSCRGRRNSRPSASAEFSPEDPGRRSSSVRLRSPCRHRRIAAPQPGCCPSSQPCSSSPASCALIYQVMWLRLLALVFGVTVYAASTVLAGFMGGLAVGSFAAGRLARQVTRPLAAFGAAEVLVGLTALGSPLVLDALTRSVDRGAPVAARFARRRSPSSASSARSRCLIVPTSLMGATLPLIVKSAVAQEASHRRTRRRALRHQHHRRDRRRAGRRVLLHLGDGRRTLVHPGGGHQRRHRRGRDGRGVHTAEGRAGAHRQHLDAAVGRPSTC